MSQISFRRRVGVEDANGYLLFYLPGPEAQRRCASGEAEAANGGKTIRLMNGVNQDARSTRRSTNSCVLHTHSNEQGYGLKMGIWRELEACKLTGARA